MTRLLQVSLAISLGLGHIFLNFILCVDWVETGIFIYLFKKEGETEKTRGRETSMWERDIDCLLPVRTSTGDWTCNPACVLTGNRTSDFLLAFQDDTHLTEPHRSGLYSVVFFFNCRNVLYGKSNGKFKWNNSYNTFAHHSSPRLTFNFLVLTCFSPYAFVCASNSFNV